MLWFSAFKVPSSLYKTLQLQQLFTDGSLLEQCLMLVQELLENKNRAASDGIFQFHGWSFFCSLLVYLSLFSMYNITYTNIQGIDKIHQAIQYRITRDYHRQSSSQI